jgi:HK97 gp10 family phage protein
MADSFKVTVNIKVKRNNDLGEYGSDVESRAHQHGYNFTRAIMKGYRSRVHVWPETPPGEHIKDNIFVEKISEGRWRVWTDRPYAAYEEYGTRYRPAHPAFRPAIEHAARDFRRELGKVFNVVKR